MKTSTLPTLLLDLVASVRGLRSRPGYFLVTTLTLAVGIASATVVFSIVDAVALAPLPYEEPDELLALYERSLEDPEIDRWPVAPATFLDWRSLESFESLAAYDYGSAVLAEEESAERIRTLRVTGNLFEVLGVTAFRGRLLTEEDVRAGSEVAVLSHGFWERVFAGDEGVVGRDIVLDGVPTRVVGVTGEAFRFPYDRDTDVWLPLHMGPEVASDRAGARLFAVGRLRPGRTRARLEQEAEALARSLAARYPETHEGRGVTVVGMRQDWLEWRLPALRIFSVAAGVALLIACLNLAGLMLSRGLARSGELAVRAALGAGRTRIAWAVLSEGLVVALLGAGLGALLADRLLPVLLASAPGNWAGPLVRDASVDGRVLAFTVLVAVGSALAASLVPVLHALRGGLDGELQRGRHAAGGRGQLRLRRGLVLGQTVLAVVLLAEAGLLGRSLYNVFRYDVGFDARNVLTARVPVSPDVADPAEFYGRLEEEVAGLPGVTATALANIVPLSGGGDPVAVTTDGTIPSGSLDAASYNSEVQYRAVDPGFFETLGIGLERGRLFTGEDDDGERVAVVNRAFTRRVLGEDREALGATFHMAHLFGGTNDGAAEPLRVVGVVSDVAEWGIWMQPPIVYVPVGQAPPSITLTVAARMRPSVASARTLETAIRDVAWSLGSRFPVEDVTTLEEHEAGLYRMNDFMLTILALFAGAAVLLAAMGLYGVVALQVGLRTRELSIRRALGAEARDILSAVVREGVVLSVVGVLLAGAVVAVLGRWIAASWLGNFLFEVTWFDPLSFGLAAGLLTLTALASSLVPARRAARVDPALVLKAEE